MNIKWILLFSASLLMVINSFGQRNIEKSRIYLNEKQNKPAAVIPTLLLKAFSQGDINAYYPSDLQVSVTYAQFLNHFDLESKAYQAIANDYPNWFCGNSKVVSPSKLLNRCMKNNFEIGEQSFKNNITYAQETKIVYLKVIYSSECTTNGLEKEGPVFLMRDIKKLKGKSKYKLTNASNSAVTYAIVDYLYLRLFRAERKRY